MQTEGIIETGRQRDFAVVLLIDDDLVSREITSTMLTMGGYAVHAAEDGDAAVRLLESGACAPAVILMDTQMPGLSGTGLIAELRACSQARLYAVSGSTPPAEILAAADGFLLKPFDSVRLRQLIENRKIEEPQTLMDPNQPAICAQVLAKLRQMMPATAVRQIYAALVADLALRIEALGTAIEKGDMAQVRRIGHAIKGGCGMAGAMQAACLGAQLEMLPLDSQGMLVDARGNGSDNSRALLRELRAAAQALESMLCSEFPV